MQQGVGFFVKIFSSEAYRDDFIKGNLYMNPLKYFMECEDKFAGNVGDKNEAVMAWLQPNELRMIFTIGDKEFIIPGSSLIKPISLKQNRFNSVNVLCLMALHSHGISPDEEISPDQVSLLEQYFSIPDDVINLGQYAVVIPNPNVFLSRVNSAAQALVDQGLAHELRGKLVTYYDESQSLSLDDENEAVFHKQKTYEHQKEYRFYLDRGTDEITHYVMKVGDLSDIAFPVMTKDINSIFKLEITPTSK